MKLREALETLRKEEKRKFKQSVDLIVNLKGIDLKRQTISLIVPLPYKIKDKQVCAFLEAKNSAVKTITKPEFDSYKEKKALKKLVAGYDFFIANAKLMPAVAGAFGKALGPSGKMPSPQLGVVTDESPAVIHALLEKISKSVKVRAKEPSIKISVGNESMSDEHLEANALAIYNTLVAALPTKKENVKNVLVKYTMTKPIGVEL
ncbi:MAG: hypothetical protein AABW79_04850 [Nanoarchaeota archaeon]